ncbi:MAG: DsrE family protein [Burkholderiales bacterium]
MDVNSARLMNHLLILNDPPYGTERSYNALRLARNLLLKQAGAVRIFLMGDAAACAKTGQKVPQGYYNIADMLGAVTRRQGEVAVCGTCMDARGMTDAELVAGAQRGTMDQLTEWTAWAGKVLVF